MHLHYNPFQYGTGLQVAEQDVNTYKTVKVLQKLTAKDTTKTQNMGCTISVDAAASIPGSPTAFISPNPVGTMKDIKMVMSPTGLASSPKLSHVYDQKYRTRNRMGYGDRQVAGESMQKQLIHAGANLE